MNVKLKDGRTLQTKSITVTQIYGNSGICIDGFPQLICRDIDEITGNILIHVGDELLEATRISFLGKIQAPIIETNSAGIEVLRHHVSGKAGSSTFACHGVMCFECA